ALPVVGAKLITPEGGGGIGGSALVGGANSEVSEGVGPAAIDIWEPQMPQNFASRFVQCPEGHKVPICSPQTLQESAPSTAAWPFTQIAWDTLRLLIVLRALWKCNGH